MTFLQIDFVEELYSKRAEMMPDAVAQIDNGEATTYGELNARASQCAQGLIAEGCKPDARVGYMGKNNAGYFEMLGGAFKANSVVVGVNWRLAGPEVAYVLNDSATEVLFVTSDFYDLVGSILSECPTVRRVIAMDGGHKEWISFADWRDSHDAIDPMLPKAMDDDVIQLYTSGTTGYPKGVQLTNGNYSNVFVQAAEGGWANWQEGDVSLVCMPLFHVAGVNVGLLGLWQGCTNIILKDVDPQEILRLMETYKINHAFMVPAVILMLLNQPNIDEADTSRLRNIIYGASPIAEDVLLRAKDQFKCDFIQVYGLTETTGAATSLIPADHDPARGKLRSCGRPNPNVDIRIVGDDGNEVAQGAVGEIIMRSKCIMKGYWNKEDATKSAVVDSWFYTGDAGYVDEEGYVYIHDRVKDMIISGGENVYPAEVENALFAHPGVADAAVIGVPDDKWGEAVKGIVVVNSGESLDADEIIAHTKKLIAGYKCPKSIDFIEVLPRNPSGKVLRRELRAPYWEGQKRQVG